MFVWQPHQSLDVIREKGIKIQVSGCWIGTGALILNIYDRYVGLLDLQGFAVVPWKHIL